jgi:hypothetical protein
VRVLDHELVTAAGSGHRDRLSRVAALLAACLLAGCSFHGAPASPRPPVDLPADVLADYRPRHPGYGLELEPSWDTGTHHESFAFRFLTYSEMECRPKAVEGRYYRPPGIPRGEKVPLIIIAPILAGAVTDYLECRIFSRWACAAGLATFYLHQEKDILTDARDGVDFEKLIRENIQDNIRALDLFVERPEVDPARLGSLGISLGAIKNVVLIAVEPRLEANVLCLAGADLPRILLRSRERRVERYVEKREEREGLTPDEVAADLERNFQAEPARFAPAIASDRVLLFLGSLDRSVPYDLGLLLREKLGLPDTWIMLAGHYSGILAAPFAANRGFAFFHRRFGTTGPTTGRVLE